MYTSLYVLLFYLNSSLPSNLTFQLYYTRNSSHLIICSGKRQFI
nr:MAG TPA: hypothetical protein [Caudoviricetes sp.]